LLTIAQHIEGAYRFAAAMSEYRKFENGKFVSASADGHDTKRRKPCARSGARQVAFDAPLGGCRTATFTVGCFSRAECVFARQPGVIRIAKGFTGGYAETPSYECWSVLTGHSEAVRVTFDAEKTSYEEQLQVSRLCCADSVAPGQRRNHNSH